MAYGETKFSQHSHATKTGRQMAARDKRRSLRKTNRKSGKSRWAK